MSENDDFLDLVFESEDFLDEEHGPLQKRPKTDAPSQHLAEDNSALGQQLVGGPGPLGLHLSTTKSFEEIVNVTLSQANSSTMGISTRETADSGIKRNMTSADVSGATRKEKASEFHATRLRIGTWERVSRYGGDLVAKCYFQKQKLIWEFLEGGLKSKIEISWSYIKSLKVTYPENGDGSLEIELSKTPLFYKEINPQPRKHTFWRPTMDFTGLQASIHRHFLECPQGSLRKHMDKIFRCDPRLYLVSQQPEDESESAYFEPQYSVFADQLQAKDHVFDNMKNSSCSPCATSSSSMKSKVPVSLASTSQETPPSRVVASGMGSQAWQEHTISAGAAEELKEPNWRDQLEVPGLEEDSMFMSDSANDRESCIFEKMTSGIPSTSGNTQLETTSQHLFMDFGEPGGSMVMEDGPATISRHDSLDEFLMQLPRIASLPDLLDSWEA